MIASSRRHRSIPRIAQHNRVNLRWIVFLLNRRSPARRSAGRTRSACTVPGNSPMPPVPQPIQNRRQNPKCSHNRQQNCPRAQRLPPSKIKLWNAKSWNSGRKRLLHRRRPWILRGPRQNIHDSIRPNRSVDAPPNNQVNQKATIDNTNKATPPTAQDQPTHQLWTVEKKSATSTGLDQLTYPPIVQC